MEFQETTGTILLVYWHIENLKQDLTSAIARYGSQDPDLDMMRFGYQFLILHWGIEQLAVAAGILVQNLEERGLRIHGGYWATPPGTGEEMLAELQTILDYVLPFLNIVNAGFIFHNYEVFKEIFQGAIMVRRTNLRRIEEEIYETNEDNPQEEVDPMVDAEGATVEQINSLPARNANAKDAGSNCPICLDPIVAGEDLRVLPCSHSFEKKCIDTWLRNSANCPMDRSKVFEEAE